MAGTTVLAGTMYATANGKSLRVVGEATYRPSGSKGESAMGMDGYHGVVRSPQPGKMGFKGRDSGDLVIADLNEFIDGSVVFELANGKVIVGRNMARVGDPLEVNTEDGTFSIEFEGPEVKETN